MYTATLTLGFLHTRSVRGDRFWTFTKNSLELVDLYGEQPRADVGLSSMNKVS